MKRKIILTVCTLILVAAIVLAAIMLLDIKTPDDYYTDDGSNTNNTEDTGSTEDNVYGKITLTIDCLEIKDDGVENLQGSGYILENVEIVINEGDSVLDALHNAAKKYAIIIDASQGYVSGIGGIYSGDFGDMSGWTYYVNGESPTVGADQYKLSDKDEVKWVYIKDFSSLWG